MLITHTLMQQIKNCYDIRSTNISDQDALLFGKAFGSEMIDRSKKKAVISFDRRRYSKDIHDNFAKGLVSAGVNVVSIGCAPTPVVQIAEFGLDADAAISVTASHNQPEYQGIKLFLDKHSFSDENLSALVNRVLQKNFHKGEGSYEVVNFKKQYKEILQQHVQIKGKFRVGWDFLNASGSDIFPYIISMLNGTHFLLNHKKDYNFGGFAPDPTYEPRLEELRQLIKSQKLDLGIVLDGDADRCVILDNDGNMVSGDSLLALFAYFQHKIEDRNVKVIWDSKSSNLFIKWAKPFAESLVSITGHSNIYNLLRASNADLGGETSGHYMFNDYYGVNDGLYAGLRLISSLEQTNMSLKEALALLPAIWMAEFKTIRCSEEEKTEVIERLVKLLSRQGITMDLSDGVKACYSYGWWMIRPSRTEDLLRVSAEGWTEDGLEQTKENLNSALAALGLA